MKHIYRPVRFYATVFAATWTCWVAAILLENEAFQAVALVLGLLAPSITAIITVFTSGSDELKQDFKEKLTSFHQLNPRAILAAIGLFFLVIVVSVFVSTFFGSSLSQLSFVEGFSFEGPGLASALLTILLASVVEELGWRGYGEDAIAQYHTWFAESMIFGCVWALWHLPLFFIPGTYHFGLTELGPLYALNFFISTVPFGFFTTWVYVKSNRSMLASILFHLFVNLAQEKIALTPETKCIETLVVVVAAVVIVLANRDLFFETRHIGNLPCDRACDRGRYVTRVESTVSNDVVLSGGGKSVSGSTSE